MSFDRIRTLIGTPWLYNIVQGFFSFCIAANAFFFPPRAAAGAPRLGECGGFPANQRAVHQKRGGQ